MTFLLEADISCPYCGETITLLVDESAGEQSYIEDCQVCCCPIVFQVRVSADGSCVVEARHENEA